MKTKTLKMPLFGSWNGVRTGFATWFIDGAIANNPHVADLVILNDRVQVRYAGADLVINELLLSSPYTVEFSRHTYPSGDAAEVNVWIRDTHNPHKRIGFKTLWPAYGVRANVPERFEHLPFINPADVMHALQALKDLSGAWGIGWNLFQTSTPAPSTLAALRSESTPIPCPGCWQERIAHPDASGPMDCPLNHH